MKLALVEAERLAFISGNVRLANLLALAEDQDQALTAVKDDAYTIVGEVFQGLQESLEEMKPDLGDNQQATPFQKVNHSSEVASNAVSEKFGGLGNEMLYFEVRRHV